jgi:chromosome segregation ATPase
MAESSEPSAAGAAASPPEAAAPARRRRVLTAAVLGGVIGAALVAALSWAWLRPALDRTADARRMAGLEQQLGRLAGLEAQLARLAAVEGQLKGLEAVPDRLARLDPLEQRVAGLAGLEPQVGRIAGLEQRLAELATSAQRLDRVDALAGELAATKEALAGARQDLARLARLEQDLARQSGELSGLGQKLAQLDQARGELAERLRAVDLKSEAVTGFPAALEGLSQRADAALRAAEGRAAERARGLEVAVAQLEERVKLALQQPGEIAAIGGALKALEQRLTQIDAKLARDRSTQDAALGELREQVRAADVQVDALALALDNLRRTHPELARLTDEVGAVKGELASGRADLGSVKADLGALKGELAPLKGEQVALGTRLGTVDQGLRELRAAQLELARAGEALAGRLSATRDELAAGLAETERRLAGELGAAREEAKGAQSTLASGLARHDAQLGELQAGLAALTRPKDTRPQAVALAVGELGEALARGGALAEPLRTLAEAGKDDPAIGEALKLLEPAASGVATLAALRQSLETVAAAFVQPEPAKPAAEGGLGERLLGTLSTVVTVKRPAAGPHGKALDAARAALARDDLGGAVAALAGVPPADNPALPGWLAEARARLDAEAGLARLRGHLRTLLTAAG